MRMLPLLADLIHARDCKPICEKLLTLPLLIIKHIKERIKLFYYNNLSYIQLTFSILMLAFFYTLHKGELKYMVDVLMVIQGVITLLLQP